MKNLTPALGALTLAFLMSSPAKADDAASRDALSGTWTYAGDETEEQKRKTSIEAATQSVPGFFRGRVRNQLSDRTKPVSELELAVQGEQVRFSGDGHKLSLKAGDEPVRIKQDGKTGEVSVRFEGTYLVLTSAGDKGQRVTTYSVSSDGDELTVAVRMSGEKLSSPIVYRSTYRRKGA